MVEVRKDLTGMVFGRLTVLCQAEDYVAPKTGQRYARWLCECSCEERNQVIITGNDLKRGKTKSCGCLQKNKSRPIASNNRAHRKHKTNEYNLTMDYGIGYCTNTGSEFYFDLEDYDKIKDYCWYENIRPNGYHALVAYIKDQNKYARMHQIILGNYYDHINRNPLDNRKVNLRKATDKENSTNRKIRVDNRYGVTGIAFNKRANKWWAFISNENKKVVSLGYFLNKEDAIIARLNGEIEYYGEFAPQQHLYEQYGINKTVQN